MQTAESVDMESQIKKILSGSSTSSKSFTKKQIKKKIKCKDENIKKILKKLVKQNEVHCREGDDGKKLYWIQLRSQENGKTSQQITEDKKDHSGFTFAEMMRRKKSTNDQSKTEERLVNNSISTIPALDIDEEINRLEAELQSDSNSDSDDDSDECEEKSGIICLSEFSKERIVPLPNIALPSNKRKKLKAIDSAEGERKPKKRKRSKEERTFEPVNNQNSTGLRDAVKELLDGYVARSSQKIPFYCRVCAIQSKDLNDFQSHKKTELHIAAVKAERKACYCRLCQKQFTSPAQMKEHLLSKPHRQKMDYVKAKQRGGVMDSRKNASNLRGTSSNRQWC